MDLSPSHVPVTVIGGGIAGLAAASRIASRIGAGSVMVLERLPVIGGKLVTVKRDGFLLEGGPDSFLATRPGGVELVHELGLEWQLMAPTAGMRRAYVRRAARLHELPEGITGLVPGKIGPLLRTRLLSAPGRVRAALEWFVVRRSSSDDESLHDFSTRRFGNEAWDWLVEPLLSGIYAGDGRCLSLQATFPQLAEAERKHGGILRAMAAARSPGESRGERGSGFVTLASGMGRLVATLGEQLGPGVVHTSMEVQAVRRDGDGYRVECADGRELHTSAVIVGTPAFAAAQMLEPLDHALSEMLREISFVSVVTVSVGFAERDIPNPLPGTGWISPRAEGGPVVACTWGSNKFSGRAPVGHVLLRLFLGRAGNDTIASADDAVIQAEVRQTLARVHGIHAEPLLWHIQRWPQGMPQYTLGHRARIEAIERRLQELPGLYVAGSSFHGVGIPDCIGSAWRAADLAIASLTVSA